jgi:formylglycine-generating enzyme required for sulfatase activity
MPLNLQYRRETAKYFAQAIIEGISIDMVYIPGGNFQMGSPEGEDGAYSDEMPQHPVTVGEFCMGKYPITQAQWRAVAGCPEIKRHLDLEPSYFKGDDLLPVEQVSWLDAEEFCLRLSVHAQREYRLLTEAEWEYACRAKTITPFHFGKTISAQVANYRAQDWELDGKTYSGKYGEGELGEFREKTTPVGSFKVANNYGLFDMHGNVWEWCQDHWHEGYQKAPGDGSAWINDESSADAPRVLRGGSWINYPRLCRSAVRFNSRPAYRSFNVGFRVITPARTS